jgi:hypothetical protein
MVHVMENPTQEIDSRWNLPLYGDINIYAGEHEKGYWVAVETYVDLEDIG